MNSLSATLLETQRARASFLPYCPLCSFVNILDAPDILHGPSHREFRGAHKLDACCMLSATTEQFESQAAAAKWWRAKRLEPLKDIATENRRKRTIEKLRAKGLEAIE